MATHSATFNYRTQIIDNCEFFVARHDIVSVITVKDGLGDFKAYAVRSNEDTRHALLSSEPCATALTAIESLHTKSCEAAHNYITANGFRYPPDLRKYRFDDDNDDDDEKDDQDDDDDAASFVSGRSASSTVALSYWGSSDDEAATTPASSADPHASHRESSSNAEKGNNSDNNNNNNNVSRRRSSKPHVTPSKPSRGSTTRFPVFELDDSEDDERHYAHSHQQRQHQQLPLRVRVVSPVRSASSSSAAVASYRPPPPRPGWTGPPMPPPGMRGVPLSIATATHTGPQPQPQPHYVYHRQPSPPQQQQQQQQANPTPLPPHAAATTALATRPTAASADGVMVPRTIGSLHYKASAPNLTTATTTTPPIATAPTPAPAPGPAHLTPALIQPPQQPSPPAPAPPTQPTYFTHFTPSHPPQAARQYDVRLSILWLGHGEQRVLESSRASIRALQELAVSYVRNHLAVFFEGRGDKDRASLQGMPRGQNGSGGGGGRALRARVRRAFFGPGEVYDMSSYRGDDLTKLFGVLSAGGIPRFEIEVDGVASSGGGGGGAAAVQAQH